MVEKSDEIWQMKHVKKLDEQNFDKLSYVLFVLIKLIIAELRCAVMP